MSRTGQGEFPVLERNEFRDEKLPAFKPLHPISKFGQVLFFYLAPDVEGRTIEVEFNKANRIAVVR